MQVKKLRTIRDIDVTGKKVILRVDFNVPLDEKTNKVTDDERIRRTLPTISYLLARGARVIVISHLGRPKDDQRDSFKMNPVGECLSKLLKKTVPVLDTCRGEKVKNIINSMKNGDTIMFPNIRYFKEEKSKDPHFITELASLGDIYVSDAFGVAHRDHASVTGIAENLPSYAGFLLEKEVDVLSHILEKPQGPVTLIMGGAKIDTKIEILKNFTNKADFYLIGGGLANTFLSACGYNVGTSLYEKDKIDVAREIMLLVEKEHEKFILPKDVIVASKIGPKVSTLAIPIQDVSMYMKILDIGPRTVTRYCQVIRDSKTIIWNGPLGLYEYPPFEDGTRAICEAVSLSQGLTVIGGGDTIDAVKKFHIDLNKFSHVSTGGGAMLEFLEGKILPGIKVLMD